MQALQRLRFSFPQAIECDSKIQIHQQIYLLSIENGSENMSWVEHIFFYLWLCIAVWGEESSPKYYPQFNPQETSGQPEVHEHQPHPSLHGSASPKPHCIVVAGTDEPRFYNGK